MFHLSCKTHCCFNKVIDKVTLISKTQKGLEEIDAGPLEKRDAFWERKQMFDLQISVSGHCHILFMRMSKRKQVCRASTQNNLCFADRGHTAPLFCEKISILYKIVSCNFLLIIKTFNPKSFSINLFTRFESFFHFICGQSALPKTKPKIFFVEGEQKN